MASIAKSPPEVPVLPSPADPFAGFLHITASVSVEVPVVGLTVRDLFHLEKSSIVVTSQPSGANVPVHGAKSLIAWGEFQVFGDRLAVRLAELV